jgi:hypothetical protein
VLYNLAMRVRSGEAAGGGLAEFYSEGVTADFRELAIERRVVSTSTLMNDELIEGYRLMFVR